MLAAWPVHRERCLLLAAGFAAVIASASKAEAQTPNGDMNVHLGVPGGVGLAGTAILVRNISIGYSQTFTFGGGLGPFTIVDLPAANGYAVGLTSTVTGGGTCLGATTGIPIFENGTTITFVGLTCQGLPPTPVPALGGYGRWLLAVVLALAGVLAVGRRGKRSLDASTMFGVHRRQP